MGKAALRGPDGMRGVEDYSPGLGPACLHCWLAAFICLPRHLCRHLLARGGGLKTLFIALSPQYFIVLSPFSFLAARGSPPLPPTPIGLTLPRLVLVRRGKWHLSPVLPLACTVAPLYQRGIGSRTCCG